jgi:DnaJ-domain-containing protein 1
MTPRFPRPRANAPDPDAPGCLCEMPGCAAAGGYRAPKSRDSLNDYWWFCLDHVRDYNARWDFYKGMTPGQIEAQLRLDTGWQRPTWPLGRLGGRMLDADALEDTLDLLGARHGRRAASPHAAAPAELREPLVTLGLDWPTTIETVKTRYKALAKLHHPDANGGDRSAEERLKLINLAYAALRTRLVAESKVA